MSAPTDRSDRPDRGARLRRLRLTALAASLAPLVLYFVLRPFAGSDTVALGLAGAAPAALALVAAVVGRRRWVSALLVAVAFGVAVAATLLADGSSLPLKLYRPIATGVFGLACLVSVAVRRPLLLHLARAFSGRDPRVAAALARANAASGVPTAPHAPGLPHAPGARRRFTVITLAVGVVCLVEAVVTTVLALSLSTPAFLIASRVARWTVAGIALAVAVPYVRRRAAREGGTPDAVRSAGKPWFARRRHGFGLRPQTWQGWVVTALLVVAVAAVKYALTGHLGSVHLGSVHLGNGHLG